MSLIRLYFKFPAQTSTFLYKSNGMKLYSKEKRDINEISKQFHKTKCNITLHSLLESNNAITATLRVHYLPLLHSSACGLQMES